MRCTIEKFLTHFQNVISWGKTTMNVWTCVCRSCLVMLKCMIWRIQRRKILISFLPKPKNHLQRKKVHRVKPSQWKTGEFCRCWKICVRKVQGNSVQGIVVTLNFAHGIICKGTKCVILQAWYFCIGTRTYHRRILKRSSVFLKRRWIIWLQPLGNESLLDFLENCETTMSVLKLGL